MPNEHVMSKGKDCKEKSLYHGQHLDKYEEVATVISVGKNPAKDEKRNMGIWPVKPMRPR
jgi:hypothetical protein